MGTACAICGMAYYGGEIGDGVTRWDILPGPLPPAWCCHVLPGDPRVERFQELAAAERVNAEIANREEEEAIESILTALRHSAQTQ